MRGDLPRLFKRDLSLDMRVRAGMEKASVLPVYLQNRVILGGVK